VATDKLNTVIIVVP